MGLPKYVHWIIFLPKRGRDWGFDGVQDHQFLCIEYSNCLIAGLKCFGYKKQVEVLLPGKPWLMCS